MSGSDKQCGQLRKGGKRTRFSLLPCPVQVECMPAGSAGSQNVQVVVITDHEALAGRDPQGFGGAVVRLSVGLSNPENLGGEYVRKVVDNGDPGQLLALLLIAAVAEYSQPMAALSKRRRHSSTSG